MKNNFFNKIEIILILIFSALILLTNNYFNLENISHSAKSSIYYFEIANSWPNEANFKNDVQSIIHAERFIIPYFLGFISSLFNIEIFLLFKITSYICLIFFIIINYKIFNFLLNSNSKIIFFSLVLFNPYIFRYFLANPLMLNDLIFFISASLLALSFFKKKNYYFYIAIFLAIISRQSSYIIILALIMTFFFPFKEKFIDYKKICIGLLILLIKIFITKYYTNKADLTEFYDVAIIGLFIFFTEKFNFTELLKFISYPILSYFPIIILSLFCYHKKLLKLKIDERSVLMVILILGFFAQPLLAGPLIAGKNIIRLSSFGYFIMIYLLCYNLKSVNFNKKFYNFLVILVLIFWSLHPTFSNIEIFKNFRID